MKALSFAILFMSFNLFANEDFVVTIKQENKTCTYHMYNESLAKPSQVRPLTSSLFFYPRSDDSLNIKTNLVTGCLNVERIEIVVNEYLLTKNDTAFAKLLASALYNGDISQVGFSLKLATTEDQGAMSLTTADLGHPEEEAKVTDYWSVRQYVRIDFRSLHGLNQILRQIQ